MYTGVRVHCLQTLCLVHVLRPYYNLKSIGTFSHFVAQKLKLETVSLGFYVLCCDGLETNSMCSLSLDQCPCCDSDYIVQFHKVLQRLNIV